MKTPTPTEVKMSALSKRHSTPRPNKQGSLPDNSSIKPSRLTRRRKTRLKAPPGPDQLATGRMGFTGCCLGSFADGDAEMIPHLLYSHAEGINVAEYHVDIGKLIISYETGCHGIRIDYLGLIHLGIELIHLGRSLQDKAEGGST